MQLISSSSSVSKTIDKSELLYDAIKYISYYEIKVGYPFEYSDREIVDSDDERRGGVHYNNPTIAYINEHGDPRLNIPARPTLIPGVERAIPQILRMLGPALRAAINNNSPIPELIDIGRVARNSVRQQILNGDHQPLSKNTLLARKQAKITITIPLIETGRLRNSLSYMIDLVGHRVYLSPKVRELIPATGNVPINTSQNLQRLLLRRKVARNWIA